MPPINGFTGDSKGKQLMSARPSITEIQQRMAKAIIGQETVVERLMIALLANGNVLMEGLPGTAKTRSIKTLSKLIESQFSRVQFTPDLLPSDVTGSEIYRDQTGSFDFQPGPIFGKPLDWILNTRTHIPAWP